MPINKTHKLIYIHIPKTGGTYIEYLFDMRKDKTLFSSGDKLLGRTKQHYPYKLIVKEVKNIENYYIFTTVRNPYYRFLSAYSQYPDRCNKKFKVMINKRTPLEFSKFLYEKIKEDGYDFFSQGSFHQFEPMVRYLNGIDNIKIIKLEENFNEEIILLCKKYNINVDLKPQNVNKNNNYDILLNNELKDIIYEIYKEDFIKFNYKK